MSDKANKAEKNDQSIKDTQESSISAINSQPAPVDPNAVYADIQNKLASSQQAVAGMSPVNQHWQKARKPRFEIELYEEVTSDETGEVTGYKKVPSEHPIIIEAANKSDLAEHAARYEFCHQRMKVVRKIDDGDMAAPQSQTQNQPQPQPQLQPGSPVVAQPIVQKQKPKFYRIGDIEIKDDNGKIFQKQWMKLSESEMSNFRVINDKNNSIVNLNGKHLEMKKWVIVEKTDDDIASLEDNLK